MTTGIGQDARRNKKLRVREPNLTPLPTKHEETVEEQQAKLEQAKQAEGKPKS